MKIAVKISSIYQGIDPLKINRRIVKYNWSIDDQCTKNKECKPNLTQDIHGLTRTMSGSKKSIEDVGNAKVSTEYHFLDRRCS